MNIEETHIIIISIIIIIICLMTNNREKFSLIKTGDIHKSDQYYTFEYLKHLKTTGKDYKDQEDKSVYDESVKKHYKQNMYLY
jgi:hypothetical protein